MTIDLWDDAIKKLIRGAKKCGYVTHDQINALLPSEEVKSGQIEDILTMLSEMRINVVETKGENSRYPQGEAET
jgi:RNA polymerase primary sigma factor